MALRSKNGSMLRKAIRMTSAKARILRKKAIPLKRHTLLSQRISSPRKRRAAQTYTIDFVEMKKAGKAKVTIVKITSGSKLKTYAFPAPDCVPEVGEDY